MSKAGLCPRTKMMNDAVEDEDSLLGTSTLRGILLLGGVVTVAFLAWKYWRGIKKSDTSAARRPALVRIPVQLPVADPKKQKA